MRRSGEGLAGRRRPGAGRRGGYALLSAIFFVFILAIAAGSVQTVAREHLRQAQTSRWRLKAAWAAEGAVHVAADALARGADSAAVAQIAGGLSGAQYSASAVPAPADLVVAYAPGSATEGVLLVTGVGQARRGTDVTALARLSALVRVEGTPATVRVLAWLPGHELSGHSHGGVE